MSAAEKTVWALLILVLAVGIMLAIIAGSVLSSVAVFGALVLDVIYGSAVM